MGGGFYSASARLTRATTDGYYTKSADDIFKQNRKGEIHQSMIPANALLREARDSDDHPESLPIILALDFTGSMGQIPHDLIKDGLPTIMQGIIDAGIPDPQILFLGIGDHECDTAPLQVGQFESSDELLDQWLTNSWIEGRGGGNEGESYLLAWYFAAKHTVTDAWEKRNQKGFLFTIGDEPSLRGVSSRVIGEIMKNGNQASYTDSELLELAKEKYNVYHLHMLEGHAGNRSLGYWEQLLGENCIQVDRKSEVPNVIKRIVTENYVPADGTITDGPVINFGM